MFLDACLVVHIATVVLKTARLLVFRSNGMRLVGPSANGLLSEPPSLCLTENSGRQVRQFQKAARSNKEGRQYMCCM